MVYILLIAFTPTLACVQEHIFPYRLHTVCIHVCWTKQDFTIPMSTYSKLFSKFKKKDGNACVYKDISHWKLIKQLCDLSVDNELTNEYNWKVLWTCLCWISYFYHIYVYKLPFICYLELHLSNRHILFLNLNGERERERDRERERERDTDRQTETWCSYFHL